MPESIHTTANTETFITSLTAIASLGDIDLHDKHTTPAAKPENLKETAVTEVMHKINLKKKCTKTHVRI